MLRETAEFRRGRNGERIVASILMRSGWLVVPSYDYSGEDNNQAPRMEGDGTFLVIPDLDACKRGRRRWIEVKTKKTATLHRKTGTLEHGISLRHFRHYQSVEAESGSPVWLVVYEENSGDLLIARLSELSARARIYEGPKMGRAGMAFFPRDAFRFWKRATAAEDAA